MFPKSMSSLTDYWSSSSSSDQTKSTYDYKVTRHSYKKNTKNNKSMSFSLEQSFDVYTPVSSSSSVSSKSSSLSSSSSSFMTTTSSTEAENNSNNNSDNNSMSVKQQESPVVVLVMGSGWLGHAPWVYYVTNWWNSGGPKQICHKLGYTCISVRHSGGFIHVVPASITNCIVATMVWCLLYVLAIQQNFNLLMKKSYNDNDDDENDDIISKYLTQIVTTIVNGEISPPYNLLHSMVGIFVFMTFLKLCHGPGANLDDMVQDVDDALNYIQSHRKELGLSSSNQALILGGYSSGGHVAATWYSRQSYLKASSSSSEESSSSDDNKATKTKTATIISRTPYDDIVGLLYISGCMSLDSLLMSAVTWTVFNKPRCDIPSPIRHLPSSSVAAKKSDDGNNNGSSSCSMMIVKHLLVGCESETFGLPLLDATFCSKEYVSRLLLKMASSSSSSSSSSENQEKEKQEHQRARYVPIPYANHWTILDSNGLVKALAIHLPWLMDSSSYEPSFLPSKHVTSLPPSLLSTSMSSSLSSSGGDEDNK